ncbi:MAG: DUF6778 family protein [Paracoccaceae bacterium]
MTYVKFLMAALSLILLSGCSSTWATDYDAPLDNQTTKNWRITSVEVIVPAELTVSDANVYAPNADIVWHGDVPGDRKQQVAKIVEAGVKRGAAPLRGGRAVTLVVQLQQFHAVTPKSVARAPAAVHNIKYTIQARDARSGAALTNAVQIEANLPANVGQVAVAASTNGQGQKQRTTNHIASVAAGWLGIGPDPRMEFRSLGR